VGRRHRQRLVQIVEQGDELAPPKVLLMRGVEEMVEDEPEVLVVRLANDLGQHRHQLRLAD
jgi:hypothetical protein